MAIERKVRIVEHAFPVPQHEPFNAETRFRIFFIFNVVHRYPVYILAKLGLAWNLILKAMFDKLTYRPKLRLTGDVRVLRGNGDYVVISSFGLLFVSISIVVF